MSVLGAELSDDSLTLSPEQLFTPGSTRKRGSKVRGYSNKRLAVSVPRPARKASPSPSGDAARRRGPGTTEERLQFLELQRAADQAEIVRMRGVTQRIERNLEEHARMSLEMRRDVYGARGTITEQMATVERRFDKMELQIEERILAMDGQMLRLCQHLEQAEAQLPVDGQVLKAGFDKLAAEIEELKQRRG